MSLALSEDERLLVDSVAGLLARSAPVSAFRRVRDSADPRRYDPALYAEMAEAGLIAPQASEADGGLGMGYAAAGLIAEQCGRTLAASPLLSATLAVELVRLAGSEARKAELIGRVLSGALIVAFAFEEGARHAPEQQTLSAKPDGDGFRLDGRKRFVLDGGVADRLIVAASTPEGLRLCPGGRHSARRLAHPARPAGQPQRRRHRLRGRCGWPRTRRSAIRRRPRRAIARALDLGRALLAAELLGLSKESVRAHGRLPEGARAVPA